jgi:hypothetical protein
LLRVLDLESHTAGMSGYIILLRDEDTDGGVDIQKLLSNGAVIGGIATGVILFIAVGRCAWRTMRQPLEFGGDEETARPTSASASAFSSTTDRSLLTVSFR